MIKRQICSIEKQHNGAPTDDRVRRLVHRLEQLSERSLEVRFNRNRWTYFSCKPAAGNHRIRVNLHEAFLEAPPEVVRAVASLIRRNDREARHVIRSFARDQSAIWDKRADRPPRPVAIEPSGRVYDLQAILSELNRRYFEGRCSVRITWGNGSRTARGQRQITFGTYDRTTELIRIHPALDHRSVPEYFVRYIVFHELLHATVPAPLSPHGKRLFHSRLFRQRERRFEDYERALAWGKHFVEDVI